MIVFFGAMDGDRNFGMSVRQNFRLNDASNFTIG